MRNRPYQPIILILTIICALFWITQMRESGYNDGIHPLQHKSGGCNREKQAVSSPWYLLTQGILHFS